MRAPRLSAAALALFLLAPTAGWAQRAEQGPPKDKPYVAQPGYFELKQEDKDFQKKLKESQKKVDRERTVTQDKLAEEQAAQRRREAARTAVEAKLEDEEKARLARRDKVLNQLDTFRERRQRREEVAERALATKRRLYQISD